jgi:hypothetical protein
MMTQKNRKQGGTVGKQRVKHRDVPPSEHEWNFDKSRVPDWQVRICCYWEYARESSFIRSVRERCRQIVGKGLKREQRHEWVGADFQKIRAALGRTAHLFQEGIYTLGGTTTYHGEVSPFPKPWQALGEEMQCILLKTAAWTPQMVVELPAFRWSHIVRAGALAEHLRGLQSCPENHESSEPKPHPQFIQQTGGSLEDFFWSGKIPRTQRPSFVYPSGMEVLLVEIEWGKFSNKQIKQCFHKWIENHRPKDLKEPSGRGHKQSDWRAKLESLGLLRLRSRYTLEAALAELAKLPPAQRKKSKFLDAGECNREAAEAQADFLNLFPFLDPAEMPLSWPMK